MNRIGGNRFFRTSLGLGPKSVRNRLELKLPPFILTQADQWKCQEKEVDSVQSRGQHTFIQEHRHQNLDFENHREAFKDRSTWDICKSLTILRMCGIEAFARNSLKLSRVTRSILGRSLHEKLLKSTVYGHFVAGDCEEAIGRTMVELRSKGIRSMIACPNEDVGEAELSEVKYDECVARMLECIRLAAMFGWDLPKTQLKVSGTLQMNLLLKLGRIESVDDIVTTVKAISERLGGSPLKIPDLLAHQLDDEEFWQLDRGIERLKMVGEQAMAQKVAVLVDAEYVNVNPGISILTLAMMDAFNRQQPIVWNTFQCYLKDAHTNISRELAIAERLGIHFGAKIVRGAYLACERARALQNAQPDPTNATYEDTSAMYDRVARFAIDYARRNRGRCSFVIATHNEQSVRSAVQKLEEVGMPTCDGAISFAQLYGMCDQITYPLAQRGYVVYKSMPFGKVDDVMPYLYRRAMENVDVLKGSRKEVKLLRAEVKHRIRHSFGIN